MISGLLLEALDSFISFMSSLLPSWTLPTQFQEYVSAFFSYVSYFNAFFPIEDGIIPALGVLIGVYGFMFVFGIFKSLQGVAMAAGDALA